MAGLIPCQRDLFAIPREVAYFNCAYMSPLLQTAVAAGDVGLRRKLQPWQVPASDFFTGPQRARELFAQLIGATADDIALIPAVSYGMATAAMNLPIRAGQTIVIPAEEFPSNVLVWRNIAARTGARIVTVPRSENGDWTSAIEAAIDEDTAVVIASETHWVCGGRTDLLRIRERSRQVGAALVIDVTQSAGVLPIDVGSIEPDFLIAAAYKWLLGPYSVGFMYVAPRWQEGRPLEEGWMTRNGAEDFRQLIDYQDAYQPGARRFDVGERANLALLPVAMAAIEKLLEWKPERIAATVGAISDRLVDAVAPLGLSALPSQFRSPHYPSLRAGDDLAADLPARLARRNVYISARGEWLRVTPHLYNDEQDVARLITALEDELGGAERLRSA